jgi:hypothetical protein
MATGGNMTKRQTIKRAQQVFGRLEHTEFCARLFKKDIPELVNYLGGWERIRIDTLRVPGGFDAYLSIEPTY